MFTCFSERPLNIAVNVLWIDIAPEFIEGFVEDMWECTHKLLSSSVHGYQAEIDLPDKTRA